MDKPEINDNRKRMCLQREDADLSATILGKRKSERLSTSENSKKSIELFNKRAGSRVQHISAKSRAIDNDRDAKVRNEANVNKLRTGNEYKKGTVRVKFKGERINRQTLGASLDGAHDKRSNWSPDQILVRNRMSEYLAWFYEKNIASSTNGRSSWYSEIAHGRAQHAGGVTDELGGQPASTHSNIEDMAREEGQRQLVERLGENVRIKSTIYVHNGGLFHGMVKASRHKLYILNESTNEWEKNSITYKMALVEILLRMR